MNAQKSPLVILPKRIGLIIGLGLGAFFVACGQKGPLKDPDAAPSSPEVTEVAPEEENSQIEASE